MKHAFPHDTFSFSLRFIIPVPVIQHFLQDIETNGKYLGFCAGGFSWQACENQCMRDALKIPSSQDGVLICKVDPLGDANRVLKVRSSGGQGRGS